MKPVQQLKKWVDAPGKRWKLAKVLVLSLLFLSFNSPGYAQTQANAVSITKSLPLDISLMVVMILVEIGIVLFLVRTLFIFLGLRKAKTYIPPVAKPSLFQRINKTVAIEDEIQLDMNHNYDGIRELDNKTPGWWIYAFYFTILFGAVYLYRMFVSESMPGQLIELKAENERAEASKAQYLVASGNNVDENTVTMLGPDEITKGSMTFKANCAVCHGEKGEGNVVGPNLTDEYWLHKGSIKDIFKTIKYGYPEKGMKSWMADFSAVQIAQLSSFILSLKGTNPPNAKAKQGDLYVESATQAVDTSQLTQ